MLTPHRRGVPRRVLVERAFAHFLARQAQAQHRLPFALRQSTQEDPPLSVAYKQLLGGLLTWAAAPYSTIRASAQKVLEAQGWRCYTWLLKQELPALVGRVAEISSSYESAVGALHLLHSPRALSKVSLLRYVFFAKIASDPYSLPRVLYSCSQRFAWTHDSGHR